jgi:hypothetical protein
VAYELGFGGVPAWLIDDRLLISGAQPHEAFGKAMSPAGLRSEECLRENSAPYASLNLFEQPATRVCAGDVASALHWLDCRDPLECCLQRSRDIKIDRREATDQFGNIADAAVVPPVLCLRSRHGVGKNRDSLDLER